MASKSYLIRTGVLVLMVMLTASCASRQAGQGPATGAEPAPTVLPAAIAEEHPDVEWSVSCLECHEEETPVAVRDWYEGMHGQVNVGCYVCHGDGEVEFHPQPTTERCVGCHGGKEAACATAGITSCFECHGGHSLKFHKG